MPGRQGGKPGERGAEPPDCSWLDPVEDPPAARLEQEDGESQDDREEDPEQRRTVAEELLREDLDIRMHHIEVVVARRHGAGTQTEDSGREQHRLHEDLERDDDPGDEVEEYNRSEKRKRDVARDLRATRAVDHRRLAVFGGAPR